MDIGCVTIVILAQTKTNAETKKNNKQKGDIKTVKTYKGFDKDLKCRGFQYELAKNMKKKRQKPVKRDSMLVKIP